MTPSATITIDLYPDGSIHVWSQKKEKMTNTQELKFMEIIRIVREIGKKRQGVLFEER